MKIHKAWRWTITYPDGAQWWGFCPRWANQPLPAGATLTRQRVMALGTPVPCTVHGCGELHVPVPNPF